MTSRFREQERKISQQMAQELVPRILGFAAALLQLLAGSLLLTATYKPWSRLQAASITLVECDYDGFEFFDPADPSLDYTRDWDAIRDSECAKTTTLARQVCNVLKDANKAFDVGVPLSVVGGCLLLVGGLAQGLVFAFPNRLTTHGGARRMADFCGIMLAGVGLLACIGSQAAMWTEADAVMNDVVRDIAKAVPNSLMHVTAGGSAGALFISGAISGALGVLCAGGISFFIAALDTKLRSGVVESKNPLGYHA